MWKAQIPAAGCDDGIVGSLPGARAVWHDAPVKIATSEGGVNWRRRALLLAAAVGLGVAALEVALRSREAGGPVAAGPSGIRGYRGPAFAAARDERGVRLLVLGDEVAYGASLPEEHTWPRQLESLFARDGMASRVELINAAEREADLARMLEQARGALLELQPMWLVVCLGANDAAAALSPQRSGPRAPLALLRQFESGPAQRAPLELPRQALNDLARATAFDFGVRLAQLIEAARGKHARVLVVLAPREWPGSAESREQAQQRGVIPASVAKAELQRALHEEAGRVANACGVRLLDASRELRAAEGALGPDGELSAEGALLLARLVHEDLRRARL